MKFKVGDKVVDKSLLRARTSYPVYQVVSFLGSDVLTKFWGDGFDGEITEDESRVEFDTPGSRCWREGIVRYQESELISSDEALAEMKRLDSDKLKLEEEFKALRTKIQSKMEQAAELVKQAQDIAESVGKELPDAYSECRPLFQAIRKSGWTPSSMSC